MGSHSRLLYRAVINVQALGDRTNPSVLWLKYEININKKVSSQFNFIFCNSLVGCYYKLFLSLNIVYANSTLDQGHMAIDL